MDSLEGQAVGGNRPQSQVILGPVIGQGSYADVHLAKRISDGKLFAVKVIYDKIPKENNQLHLVVLFAFFFLLFLLMLPRLFVICVGICGLIVINLLS